MNRSRFRVMGTCGACPQDEQMRPGKTSTTMPSQEHPQQETRYLEIRNQVGELGEDGLAKVGRRLSRGAEPSTSSNSSKEKTP